MGDFLLILLSQEYRDVFGATNQITDSLWRIFLDLMMTGFYGVVFYKHKEGNYSPRLLLWHGVFFGLVGIALCVPWGGYFLAPFSPIGMPYLVAIGWVPYGYFISIFMALVFIIFNIYLIRTGLSSKTIYQNHS